MDKVEEIIRDDRLTVAEKMRRLHVLGLSRSEIAQRLNKRYQHVRNTLVGPGADVAIEATRRYMEAQEDGSRLMEARSAGREPLVNVASRAPSTTDWESQLLDEIRQIRRLLEKRLPPMP